MPLGEPPNLVALLIAIQTAAIEELYRELGAAGFTELSPASAPIFQFVRPGGSDVQEIAGLAGVTVASIAEQVSALERSGYATGEPGGAVELTARGQAAAQFGLRTLDALEERWRGVLGSETFQAFAGALAQLNLDPLGRRGRTG